MATFEAALHDTLDLTPDQVEALYHAFVQNLPALLGNNQSPKDATDGFGHACGCPPQAKDGSVDPGGCRFLDQPADDNHAKHIDKSGGYAP